MANSDYQLTGSGAPTTVANLSTALSYLDTNVIFTSISHVIPDDVAVGQGVLIGDEILKITALFDNHFTAERGCADTIPQTHAAGSIIWFFETGYGFDNVARAGTETIAVKQLTYTNSQQVPIAASPPDDLTFNMRFARPYAPGNMLVNGASWFSASGTVDNGSSVSLTWKHRDRIVQADQLIGHTAENVGPEEGVTYTIYFYDADDELLGQREGITGNSLVYTAAMAKADIGQNPPRGVQPITFELCATRDALDSWSSYSFTINVDTTAIANPYGLGYRLGQLLGGRPHP